jgi:calpain-15
MTELVPQAKIFNDIVEPSDIAQGYLGDCYFLAGLAALAERPDRIFNLFLVKDLNSVRYFSVKMLYKGKWLTIDMD